MNWRRRIASLWGGGAPPSPSRPVARKPGAQGTDRAALIAAAMAAHRQQGAPLRAELQKAIKALADRRTLRDPAALERLLALAQAQQALARLFANDLRRYVVLAGLRHWLGPDGPATGPASRPAAKVVVRR